MKRVAQAIPLFFVSAITATAVAECPPLMRGALWWVTAPYYTSTEEELAATVAAQEAVQFDLLWLMNCPALLKRTEENAGDDILRVLFELADARGMRVIVDLPRAGWYRETESAAIIRDTQNLAERMARRYGEHRSFYGWYLNYEINPIAPDDTEQTAFWREAWKGIVKACDQIKPEAVTTISPFFLLDKERKRGFVYQTPEEYAAWWGETLKVTGIDVLMLQDSGEHLGFFTLQDREPFWAATANACHKAGARFWLNVESAEVPATSWEEYLAWERDKTVRYEVLPIDKLAGKLRAAARYADSIVNWGYFPFMNPLEPTNTRVDGAEQAYLAYKGYVTETAAGR